MLTVVVAEGIKMLTGCTRVKICWWEEEGGARYLSDYRVTLSQERILIRHLEAQSVGQRVKYGEGVFIRQRLAKEAVNKVEQSPREL